MIRQLGFLCLIAVVSGTAAALAQETPPTDCDRYAAEADDPERQAAGVADEDLNAALAVPACERAVEQDAANRRLVFQLGRAYLKDGNADKAVARFREAAEQGHVLAQTYLGTLYLEGTGPARDDTQAVLWFTKGAEQGDAVAQYNLAVMQETGRGTAKDEAQAAGWYRKSAEQGFALAQSSLGRLYTSGRGVVQDEAQAADWFRRAAEQGDASGQYRLAGMYADGRGVARDAGQAMLWYRKAAEQNYLDAAQKAAALAPAESTQSDAAPPPPAPSRWLGAERIAAQPRWLLLIALGGTSIGLIVALSALLLVRSKRTERSVARQLQSLKLESLNLDSRKGPDGPQKESPASALSSLASQIEAIPAAPTDEPAIQDDGAKRDDTAKQDAAAKQDEATQQHETVADSVMSAAAHDKTAASGARAKDATEPAAASALADDAPAPSAAGTPAAEPSDGPAAPSAMKRCSQCQNEIPHNDYFCCHCGALAIRFSDCRHEVRDNARFCARCGAILRWSTPKAAVVGDALPPAPT